MGDDVVHTVSDMNGRYSLRNNIIIILTEETTGAYKRRAGNLVTVGAQDVNILYGVSHGAFFLNFVSDRFTDRSTRFLRAQKARFFPNNNADSYGHLTRNQKQKPLRLSNR